MLRDSDLGKDLWGEVLSTHVYICIQCPSSTLPGNIMPYEKVFTQTPCIKHLHVFGSKCFIKVPDETWSKLNNKNVDLSDMKETQSMWLWMQTRRNYGHTM